MYVPSSLPSLAASDSLVVSGVWKDADLLNLRAAIPVDGTAMLRKVDMSAMSFSGEIVRGMYSVFYNCPHLEQVLLPNTVQASKVNLRRAFADNPLLRCVANLENLQNVTSIDTLFRNCVQLQSVAFSSVSSNANTVSCTRAFNGCTALKEVDLSHFAALSEGNNLFDGCENLERVRFADTGNGRKNSFSERFKGCAKLQTIENLDKFTNISAISNAFENCSSLKTVAFCAVPQTMSGSGKETFRGCAQLVSVANLGIFTQLSNFEAMFRECASLEAVDLPENAAAKNAKQIFYKCASLRRADLSKLAALADFESAFNGCSLLEDVVLSAAGQSATSKFNSTFAGCMALRKVRNFDKYTNVGSLSNTFKQCAALDSVRFGCDPSAVASTIATFDDCNADCLKYMLCGTKKAASWQDKGTPKTASYNDSTFIYDIRVSTFDEQTVCDQYVWHGATYTESGDFLYVIEGGAANGCDSIDRLRLAVCQSFRFVEKDTVCDSLLWQGEWLKESNTYTKNYTTVQGCDSTYTLNLTVRKSTAHLDVQVACDAFSWIDGNTYTESNNTATHRLTNAAGCDSVVTLNLTLDRTRRGGETLAECAAFVWRGKTYTQSGVYRDTIPNGAACGCDSIAMLNLTILPVALGDTAAVVQSGSFVWHGQTYTMPGEYRDTLVAQAANGCDSVVTLELTFCTPYRFEQDSVACDAVFWQGEWRTASGDYTESYKTAAGCDSVYVLHLLLIPPPQAVVPDLATFCDREAVLDVPYELSAGQPDRYSLLFDSAAQRVGFADVEDALLPSGFIAVDVPRDAPMGDYLATLRIFDSRAVYGCASVSLPLHITLGFDAARYLTQKWNDVIVVNNSGDSRHPMRFVAYQWYKNGQKIDGATLQHLYEADGLDWSAVYTVDLTTEDGRRFHSCGFVPQPQSERKSEFDICPNPVAAGAPFELVLPDGVSSVCVCSAQGVVVCRLDRPTESVMTLEGLMSGVYVVCAVMRDGCVRTAKLAVE